MQAISYVEKCRKIQQWSISLLVEPGEMNEEASEGKRELENKENQEIKWAYVLRRMSSVKSGVRTT